MLERTRARMKERYAAARLRETGFLMSFDIVRLNGRLVFLLSLLIGLNFLDALTTLVAINLGPSFVELNPIASGLFRLDFIGFMAALALKYIPIIPLVYATLLPADSERVLALRIVKVSALIALVAADLFYIGVVGSNSLNLARYYFGGA
jgi:hypothetical protein